MAFTDIDRSEHSTRHRRNVLDSLLRVLPQDESDALKEILDDHTIVAPRVQRIIREQGEDPHPNVPEYFYHVGESTIRRYRERHSVEVNGL